MTQMLRLALGAMVIAAGCGGGDDDGEEMNGGGVSCGDGTCTTSVMLASQIPEDCRRCPQDCGVCEGCGNGMCEGNLAIGTGENCLSCVEDCACGENQQCSEVTSDRDAICGTVMCDNNGTCDAAAGETCQSCADCGECPDACGDGTCDSAASEDCASCAADCGCADGQRCWSWDDELDPLHALPPNAAEYRVGSICGADNPLFAAIPGGWRWTELEGSPPIDTGPYDFGVDIIATGCYIPDHETGDACVYGFTGFSSTVLSGSRLFLHDPDGGEREGEVLDGGTRMEHDDYRRDNPEEREHSVWVKEE